MRMRLTGLPALAGSIVLRSAIALRWNARLRSLLELTEACSVPVRWSCRAAFVTTARVDEDADEHTRSREWHHHRPSSRR